MEAKVKKKEKRGEEIRHASPLSVRAPFRGGFSAERGTAPRDGHVIFDIKSRRSSRQDADEQNVARSISANGIEMQQEWLYHPMSWRKYANFQRTAVSGKRNMAS